MLSVLIVDDEIPARQVLRGYLDEFEGAVVVGEAEDGQSALTLAAGLKPAVVLLDVEMPGMNGIEAAARLPSTCAVIFVTAYDRYAIKAFELHAVDYLLKPVMKERLFEALARVTARATAEHDLSALVEFFRARSTYITKLTIKNQFEYLVVSTFDISYIAVEAGLVFVYTRGLKYTIDTPLKKLEARLDPAVFVRIHRAILVNKNHITKITSPQRGRFVVQTSDHAVLPVSRDYLACLKAALGWEF